MGGGGFDQYGQQQQQMGQAPQWTQSYGAPQHQPQQQAVATAQYGWGAPAGGQPQYGGGISAASGYQQPQQMGGQVRESRDFFGVLEGVVGF